VWLACLRLGYPQVTLGVIRHNGSGGVPMPRFDNPTVLATRPQAASDRFVEALKAKAGPFKPVISPAFEIVQLASRTDMPMFEVAVFTSREGVAHAPKGSQRRAYCVGSATGRAAEAAGYLAVNAGGDVGDLIEVILADSPKQSLLHIRGEVSTGDVTSTLTAGGVNCSDHVAYHKKPLVPKGDLQEVVRTAPYVIFPIFSGETVSILADWKIDFSTTHVVAISPVVATAARRLEPLSITVSPVPDMQSMVLTTASLIA